ncbi:MAG: cell division protein FtsI [Lachnospiraceae bacterium]|nr:cell division protein FtsI [Lachnospiraceae bacterium]
MNTISAKIIIMAVFMIMFFAFLIFRTWTIMRDNGEKYKKQVLNQQKYDSRSIPYQRGAILDRNGTLLAYSERVYNVILDTKMALKDTDSIEPTFNAVSTCLGIDTSVGSDLRDYMAKNPESQYHVAGLITYEQRQEYEAYIENYNATITEENKKRDTKLPLINKKAIWFEDQFKRTYPGGTLACDVIGFTTSDGRGQYGLEEYYDDMLTGKNGREYGYLTAENALERTVVPAQNGYTLVTTIDSYVQRVCEEKLKEYDEAHTGEFREGEMGADNTGVIVMDIHSGEILAMASYPNFNLNDPHDMSMYTELQKNQLIEKWGDLEAANQSLWKNFCISQSYEPGSVCKTFTVAAALDAGVIHDGDSFDCRGYLTFGEGSRATTIRCHQRYGDGVISLKQAVEKSCNVALMLIGQKLGKEKFLKYQRNFNFGLRTNIDLAGEMRTATLVFNKNNMGITELMTSTFGQGFNVTMIQNISAYASLVNGGYYYQPHMVKQIKDSAGAVVENIEPTIVRQVVSESVSRLMIDYCIGVVDEGTGTRARPAGYRIGGKTGTAERSGQGKRDYTVSFMGFAPANDPQIAIYVVVDRPNTASQENGTRNACILCKDILTEILPYLHIFMTEPLTAAERKELEEKGLKDTLSQNSISDSASENEASAPVPVEEKPDVRVLIDDKTGYAIDPINGEYLDPETGVPINGDSSIFQDANGNPVEIEVLKDEEEEKLDPRE